MAARNGSSGRANFSIGRPLIAMPTNRQSPTGGVKAAQWRSRG
jgi:hypothetical protein